MGPALHGIILWGRTTLSARLGAFLVVRRGGAPPLPRATARVAPTDGNKERGKRGVEDAAPYGGEQEVRYGGRGSCVRRRWRVT